MVPGLFYKGYSKYKPQIAVMFSLAFLSAFVESIGVSMLIPLFSKIAGGQIAQGAGSAIITALSRFFNFGLGFKVLLSLIVLAFVLKSLLLFLANYFSTKVGADYERDTRRELIHLSLSANWPFLIRQKVGYLETILIKDVDMARALFAMIAQTVINVVSLTVYIFIALSISAQITLLSLAMGLVLFLVLKPFLYKIKEISNAAMTIYTDTAHHIGQNIIGIKSVKSNSVEERVESMADKKFRELRDIQVRMKFFQEIPHVLYEPVGVAFIVGIFIFLFVTKQFEVGVFAAVMYLVHRIFTHALGLQSALYKTNQLTPFLQRIVGFRDEMARNKEHYGGEKPFQLNNSLEFRDVEFAYNQERRVLNGVSFRVERGRMVGVVGKSGAGKTTMVDLLLRFLGSTHGRIEVDGVDISEVHIKEWRKNISYVAQESFLLNDSIANNIKFYDHTISDKRMEEGAKMAYIYDFIQKQKSRFETQVGERGVLLSGGEKQRVVLARALARQPQILVLDEATSALDNESELMIQKAIEELKGKITILVIAHRLTTLLNCDKIIFLEDGRIKEEGPPQELLKDKNSQFFQLYNIRDHAVHFDSFPR